MVAVIATLGLSPAVVTEIVDALLARGKEIEEIFLAATKGAELSHHVLNKEDRGLKIIRYP